MLVNDSIVMKNLMSVEYKAGGLYEQEKKRESAFQKSVPLISKQTLRLLTCEKKMY
jgi:hypothetical protein